MEIVSVLNLLRRHWLLVLPGVFLALLVGVSVLYHVSPSSPHLQSRGSTSGVAEGQTLITSSGQLPFELSDRMDLSETLPSRAAMLANLLAGDQLRSDIAARAGIDRKDLVVFGPSSGAPPFPVPISQEATAAARIAPESHAVYVTTADQPPLIDVRATAPDPAAAAKLVDAVRGTISGYLATAASAKVHLGSEPLGPVQVGLAVNEPSKFLGVVAALMVFAFWCAGVVVVMGFLSRIVRARAAAPAATA